MQSDTSEQLPRPMTSQEQAMLVALITRGDSMDENLDISDDDRIRWLAQVPATRAGHRCDCGACPSIELTDPAGVTPDMRSSRVVLAATTTEAMLLLFIDDDHLSYLELAPLDDQTAFQHFPDPALLQFGR